MHTLKPGDMVQILARVGYVGTTYPHAMVEILSNGERVQIVESDLAPVQPVAVEAIKSLGERT
jgi:murein DD-endopeptidase MepM/ murein hydrolase activator NlpD